MTRNLLIIIGIGCAVISAAGIMYYTPLNVARRSIDNKDRRIRIEALATLSDYCDKQSIPQIRKLLYDNDDMVFLCAGNALFHLNDRESLPEIRKFLEDKNPEKRASTLAILSDFRDRESIPQMRKLLYDSHKPIFLWAGVALSSC